MVVALVIGFYLLPFQREWVVCAAFVVVMLLAAGPLAWLSLKRIMTSAYPMVEAVNGLLLVLALLVLSFAGLYLLLALRTHGQMSGLETKTDAIYFTVTIVATVGFGDITATGQAARALVTVNMLLDLLFLGATFRLLGWAVKARGRS